MALNTTQPTNQAPTGNLFMAPSGATYANQSAYQSGAAATGGNKLGTAGGTVSITNPTGAPNVSTTTISNSNKINAVPGIINTTNTLGTKGVTTDPATGVATYANGAPAIQLEARDVNGLLINPPGATYDRNTGHLISQPTVDDGTQPLVTPDTSFQDQQILDNLEKMKSETDASTADQISNIQQKFAQAKTEQTDANTQQAKRIQNALLMGGVTGQGSSAQYAPISSEGIAGAQVAYGIKQLAALDAQENDLIAQAKAAQASADYKIMEDKNAEIDKVRQKKLDLATDLNKTIQARNDKIAADNIQATKDSAVADIFATGVTDVPGILKALKSQGVVMTASQVADTLDTISKNAGVGGVPELKNDTDEFFYLKSQQNGLPPSILSLPDTASQLAAYLKMKNTAITAGKTKITPASTSSGTGSTVPTKSGSNVVAGVTLPSNVSGTDVLAVLEGRDTLQNIRQTVGRSKEADAKMQNLRDAIYKIDPTFDFVASNAGGKVVSSPYYQKAIASIDAVMPNIDKIVDLSNQVDRLGVKGVDSLLQSAKVQIGNQKVSNFKQAQKLIADEIGVALGAGTVSDMKLQLGFDVTDPAVTPEVFASNMEIVKEFIQNRKDALNGLRYSSPVVSGTSHSGVTLPGDETTVSDTTFNGIILPH